MVATGGAETQALEDQPVVAAYHWRRAVGTERAEPRQTRFFEGALSFLRAAPLDELVASYFAVVAVNDLGWMTPGVGSARDMR